MKIDEIKEMPAVELQAKGRELREELFQLNMQNSQGLLEKPHRIRDLRRDIAKVETLLSQKRNGAAAA